jgi:uncharacterized membrane protein
MALSLRSNVGISQARPTLAARKLRTVRPVVCQAESEKISPINKMALPLASMVTACVLASAFLPMDADAGQRSGGRVGGGFSSRSAAPRAAAPRAAAQSAPRVTNVYSAPSVIVASPYGYGGGMGMGMGMGGGFGFMPTFMPIPIFGGVFQLFFVVMIAGVMFNVVKGFMGSSSSTSKKEEKKDDTWGDL